MRQLYAIILILLVLSTSALADDYYDKHYDMRPQLEEMPLYKDYLNKRDSYIEWYKQEVKKPVMERDFEEMEHKRKEIHKAWIDLNKWLEQFGCFEPKPWR